MIRYSVLIPFALLAGCSAAEEEAAAPEPVATVRVAPATLGASSNDVVAYGATEAAPGDNQSLVAPAEAVIGTVLAPTGTAVGRGQAVVILRASPATAVAAGKAASDVQVARAALARALRLRADGLVSDADVETARAAAQTANTAAAHLGIGGGGLTLRAPAAGTVQNLNAKPGDQVAAGTTIASIAKPGDLRARISVDPAVAQRIHPGQSIRIQPVNGGAESNVAVVGVDPQIDPTTRLASVFVRVPGSGMGAGTPIRATLSVGATASGITIPYAALLDDGGRSYVFVVKNGVAKSVDVSPGNTSGDRVEILKGLSANDSVVTEGGTALEDGMKVKLAGAGASK
jgi:RND family efflux transporter MFP subunit